MFRPVSRRLSLIETLLSVTACAIQALADIFLSPLLLPAESGGARAGVLGYIVQPPLAMHRQALFVSLMLLGGFDLLVGSLIIRSGFLPRACWMLMAIAGTCWLLYLSPPLAVRVALAVQPLGFVAEFVLTIWLLARG